MEAESDVRTQNHLTVQGTEATHIPQELRPAAEDLPSSQSFPGAGTLCRTRGDLCLLGHPLAAGPVSLQGLPSVGRAQGSPLHGVLVKLQTGVLVTQPARESPEP